MILQTTLVFQTLDINHMINTKEKIYMSFYDSLKSGRMDLLL